MARADADGRVIGRDLGRVLQSLEGGPYPAYRDIRGEYQIGPATLEVLHVQPDPYAPPSVLRITLPLRAAGIEPEDESDLATEDFLARGVEEWLRANPDVGSIVQIDPAGQQVLRRTTLALRSGRVELLLQADLPARGRRIAGRRAAAALSAGLARLVQETLVEGAPDARSWARHRAVLEDHRALRAALTPSGWVGFVADGSMLPRRTGADDAPLAAGGVPFVSPPELAAEVVLPHAGTIRGMAIPRGIVLLCGGAFHGKSTLLRALGAAVYPHIPGDGRERVATDPTAMGIRAEDGRAITGVDLRAFLDRLPNGTSPGCFVTANASGATSQAAAIMEALASGSRCLLIDEDTSATNFLLRDSWVGKLLRPGQEPVTPLLSRLREIHERFGASTILVVGGSGEAFRVADTAIVMDAYRPIDATTQVAGIREEMGPGPAVPPAAWPQDERILRVVHAADGNPRVRALGARRVLVGKDEIDLSASVALVHASQGRTLGTILTRWFDERKTSIEMPRAAGEAARQLEAAGPGAFANHPRGDLAEVRVQEITMLIDRLRNVTGGAGRF